MCSTCAVHGECAVGMSGRCWIGNLHCTLVSWAVVAVAQGLAHEAVEKWGIKYAHNGCVFILH